MGELENQDICSKCESVLSKEDLAVEGSDDLCLQCRIAQAEELIESRFEESSASTTLPVNGVKKKRTMVLLVGLITIIVTIGILVPVLVFGLNSDNTVSSPNLDSTDDLTILMGKWNATDGILSPEGQEKHQLIFGNSSWTNYELNVNAELISGNGYGIYYRVDGEVNLSGYCFQYIAVGTPKFLVRSVLDGREKLASLKILAEEHFPEFDAYTQTHEITIRIEDDQHTIQVNGKVIAEFTDDSFSSGMAGLRTWSTSEVQFRDIAVNELSLLQSGP
ncbi:MAG: DUF1080 domain-containing protein [Chloroflexi bacterium]|jgi:hypothetical protein|nr:DUF1080 domain-containing protein [Chloroflexota bacterium]